MPPFQIMDDIISRITAGGATMPEKPVEPAPEKPAPDSPEASGTIPASEVSASDLVGDITTPVSIEGEMLEPPKKRRRRQSTQVPDFSDLNQPPAEPPPDYQMMSEVTFDMSTGTLAVVFGPEWQPKSTDERAAVVGALKKYFEAKQAKDIPPGMLLLLVIAAYSAPRLREPATAGKLTVAWSWTKTHIVRWWFRRRGNTVKLPMIKLKDDEQHESHG